jgi:centromere protein I
VKVTRTVERVTTKCFEEGIPSDLLDVIVDLITLPNELDQASIGALIRNLYPTSKISDECIMKAVGSLGHGQIKPSYPSQAALLKWIIMVYDFLENPKILERLYSVLFNLIDTVALRYVSKGSELSSNTRLFD